MVTGILDEGGYFTASFDASAGLGRHCKRASGQSPPSKLRFRAWNGAGVGGPVFIHSRGPDFLAQGLAKTFMLESRIRVDARCRSDIGTVRTDYILPFAAGTISEIRRRQDQIRLAVLPEAFRLRDEFLIASVNCMFVLDDLADARTFDFNLLPRQMEAMLLPDPIMKPPLMNWLASWPSLLRFQISN